MDEELGAQVRRAWRKAHQDGREMTHWVMTHETLDRLIRDTAPGHADLELAVRRYMGLPIYFVRDLDSPGFLLRDGDPPDELREAELHRQLAAIHRRYQDLVRPIVDELAKIEARKPPTPMLFPSTLGGVTVPPR